MKNSFKIILQETIFRAYRDGTYVPYDNVKLLCEELGYKISNAERRLRSSESPMVETLYGKSGAITGYRWKQTANMQEVESLNKILSDWRNNQKQPIEPRQRALFN